MNSIAFRAATVLLFLLLGLCAGCGDTDTDAASSCQPSADASWGGTCSKNSDCKSCLCGWDSDGDGVFTEDELICDNTDLSDGSDWSCVQYENDTGGFVDDTRSTDDVRFMCWELPSCDPPGCSCERGNPLSPFETDKELTRGGCPGGYIAACVDVGVYLYNFEPGSDDWMTVKERCDLFRWNFQTF